MREVEKLSREMKTSDNPLKIGTRTYVSFTVVCVRRVAYVIGYQGSSTIFICACSENTLCFVVVCRVRLVIPLVVICYVICVEGL